MKSAVPLADVADGPLIVPESVLARMGMLPAGWPPVMYVSVRFTGTAADTGAPEYA